MPWIESLATSSPSTWALLLAVAPTLFGFGGGAVGWFVATWWKRRTLERLEEELATAKDLLSRADRDLRDERELCHAALHDLTFYRWLEIAGCIRLAKVESSRPLQVHRWLRQRVSSLLGFSPQLKPSNIRDGLFAKGVLLDQPALSLPDFLEMRGDLVERFEAPLEKAISDR